VTQVGDNLPSKLEALRSNYISKKKRKEKEVTHYNPQIFAITRCLLTICFKNTWLHAAPG
jgi:hypothetical protein